ncbi:hypothetical protein A4G20_03000 [Pasteurellaceae bacterium RH1A]|nr:hypothetical protein A4G20_03000 [Pasteurellaceae bacterium RH1A]
MKILFIITGLGTGGAEKQVCDLADMMSAKGHEIKIISLTEKPSSVIYPRDKKVNVFFLNMTKNPIGFVKAYLALRKEVRQYNPDIIHSHMFHANIMARLLKFTTKTPMMINTAHNTNEGGRLRMLAYRLTNFLSDLNTNVSQDAVEAFIEKKAVKKGQMLAIPNGIDIALFYKDNDARIATRKELQISDSTQLFVAVGRLTPQKDYPNLLQAFSIVKQAAQDCHLCIVGTGELEPTLKQKAIDLGIADSVRFLGLRRDIPAIMNSADTYVMSSHYEGLPLVIGEAMACENVIVATDCGGTLEVIGEYGFLVPIQDSQALATKMLETIHLPLEKREYLGKHARKHIKEHYSLETVVNKWLEIYNKKSQ